MNTIAIVHRGRSRCDRRQSFRDRDFCFFCLFAHIRPAVSEPPTASGREYSGRCSSAFEAYWYSSTDWLQCTCRSDFAAREVLSLSLLLPPERADARIRPTAMFVVLGGERTLKPLLIQHMQIARRVRRVKQKAELRSPLLDIFVYILCFLFFHVGTELSAGVHRSSVAAVAQMSRAHIDIQIQIQKRVSGHVGLDRFLFGALNRRLSHNQAMVLCDQDRR